MHDSMPEEELIAKLRHGDKRALKQLYGLHYRTLCHFAAGLVIDSPQAEDIVAEAYVKLYNLRANFDTLTNIRAFLFITVRNACFNYLRHQKRVSIAKEELFYLNQQDGVQLQFHEIEADLLDKIYQEIEALPKQCKQVFKLFYLERLNTTEIALHMKLSRNTVQNHKIRAMKLLRTMLLKRHLLSQLIMYSSFPKFNPYYAIGLGMLGLG